MQRFRYKDYSIYLSISYTRGLMMQILAAMLFEVLLWNQTLFATKDIYSFEEVPMILSWATYFPFNDWKSLYTQYPGGRLNKKDGLTRYGNSHVKDKTS